LVDGFINAFVETIDHAVGQGKLGLYALPLSFVGNRFRHDPTLRGYKWTVNYVANQQTINVAQQ
jgi:hypothetical protein